MSKRLLAVLLLAGAAVSAPAGGQSIFASGFEDGEMPPAGVASGGLGTNLEGVEDFSVAYPFTDLFKQSRPWITSSPTVFDTDDADQLDLDTDGWVRSLPACSADPQQFCFARTVINSSEADWPNGEWLVLYEGSGTLSYSGAASLQTSAPGRDVIAVNSDGIVIVTLQATAPAPNHVRNIRVFPPGFDPAIASVPTFHPDFIAELTPYRTLRFMDWMRTNGGGFGGAPNPQVEFSDRALPADAHWTREAGVPLETMIELANLTGAEPWFTLPHQASDAYIADFAQLLLTQLAPQRRIYIEHSNEVWNNFPQRFDIEDDARINFTGPESDFTKRMNQHGLRTARICAIVRQQFGSDADRVVCTLGTQAANTFTASEAADCPLAVAAGLVQGACLQPGDAIAIAPYFGNYLDVPSNANELQFWALDELLLEITDGGQIDDAFADSNTPCTDNFPQIFVLPCPVSALDEVNTWIGDNRDAADARQLRLLAYEGGQHLVGVLGVENNVAIRDLFVAANRDARMQGIYESYLLAWKNNGGELFVHFNLSFGYGRFGSWGVLEALGQTPRPPKADAIDGFNLANPCWWPNCNVDGSSPPPPPPPPPVECPSQLLLDPGLEATDFSTPGAPSNPRWTSTSANFGSVLCNGATCPDDGGTSLPHAGSAWAWFGGIDAAESASLSQTLTIPSGESRHLNFFLRRGFVSAPFDAVLQVRVDGQLIASFDEPTVAEPDYLVRSVDLGLFADGLAHTIRFDYLNSAAGGKSNFILDDITLDCTQAFP